jgi:pimeloyl-ACP methyl ester carboxylesterase
MGTNMIDQSGWQHRVEHVNGIRLHMVEAGSGPLVLLVHGFPESWYSWRHQIAALAAADHHVVAIDVRGYGRSSQPTAIDAYRMVCLVADNVALVQALGYRTAVIVGHDWGAPIAWTSALLRPDVFTSVAGLSVPYNPPGHVRPSTMMRQLAGSEEFYIEYFQQPGRAEAEMEADVRRWLLGFYHSASGDAWPPDPAASIATVVPGTRMSDRFRYPESMPSWMTTADLDFYTAEFEHTGFTGGLNRYRNIDRDWEDLATFRDQPIIVPALFIGGDRDGPTIWGAPAIDAFGRTLPLLHKSTLLSRCGHWTQQERADEVNQALVEFLGAV